MLEFGQISYGDYNSRYNFCFPSSDNRTPEQAPYGYDPYFIWGDQDTVKGADAVYSDRLSQWDYDKNSQCVRDHLPTGRNDYAWRTANQKQASAYMTAYYGKPYRAVAIAEGCNVSNGYPYWIIWFVPVTTRSRAKRTKPT